MTSNSSKAVIRLADTYIVTTNTLVITLQLLQQFSFPLKPFKDNLKFETKAVWYRTHGLISLSLIMVFV